MKKVIISPYFGPLPNYFDLFIDSCKHNNDFDFLIITDQVIKENQPNNIRVINMTFEQVKTLVKIKIDRKYTLFSPYKLCDYKPAFGKIFEDYIKIYDFWGHCDMDMLFGHISDFISDIDFKDYDKLLIKGHLTFYKNTEEVNEYFLLESDNCMKFDVVTSYKEPCFFDEIVMPKILSNHGIRQYTNYSYADILPQYLKFTLANEGPLINYDSQKFYYENGKIYREYVDNGANKTDSFMYIHLQKRKMVLDDSLDLDERIYIQPNIFTNKSGKITPENALMYRIHYEVKRFRKLNLNKIIIKLRSKIILWRKAQDNIK